LVRAEILRGEGAGEHFGEGAFAAAGVAEQGDVLVFRDESQGGEGFGCLTSGPGRSRVAFRASFGITFGVFPKGGVQPDIDGAQLGCGVGTIQGARVNARKVNVAGVVENIVEVAFEQLALVG